jgi:hypothetical protein
MFVNYGNDLDIYEIKAYKGKGNKELVLSLINDYLPLVLSLIYLIICRPKFDEENRTYNIT